LPNKYSRWDALKASLSWFIKDYALQQLRISRNSIFHKIEPCISLIIRYNKNNKNKSSHGLHKILNIKDSVFCKLIF
jgi:hypothetical protein